MQKRISEKEFEKLSENCDIVLYQNLVINVSKFDHPGGSSLLKSYQGKDISSVFNQTSHSLNAKLMLRDLTIGYIDSIKTSSNQLFTCQEMKTVNVYDSIKNKFDPNLPIGQQVAHFTRQQFITFINYPKFIKDGQLLEVDKQDTQKDRTDFWINIPVQSLIWVVLFCFSINLCQKVTDILSFMMCCVLAMFVWSGIQYYFHRIKLHRQLDLAETADQAQFVKLAKSHLIHHAFPNYPLSIVIQLKTTIPSLTIIFISLYLIISLKIALFFVTGLIFCVIAYDCLHYFFHFGWEPTWPLFVKLKKNHLKHHYKNTNRGFGVTTTFWDKIFGTQHI